MKKTLLEELLNLPVSRLPQAVENQRPQICRAIKKFYRRVKKNNFQYNLFEVMAFSNMVNKLLNNCSLSIQELGLTRGELDDFNRRVVAAETARQFLHNSLKLKSVLLSHRQKTTPLILQPDELNSFFFVKLALKNKTHRLPPPSTNPNYLTYKDLQKIQKLLPPNID